jgi:hydroxypyruvate reductase
MNDVRQTLLDAYRAAVAAAHPAGCVPPHLPEPGEGRILVVGAGKANAAMAAVVEAHYRALGKLDRVSGLVSTRHGAKLPTERIEVLEAGHPVPDAASLAGAARALAIVRSAQPGDLVLCLMSGGASALWAAPVAGVTFEAKQRLTRQLLRSGVPIGEMNTVRRRLSQIKGGRLLAALPAGASMLTLAISDVPGDVPAAIGSGPSVRDATTLADARAILARYAITPEPEISAALADPANEAWQAGSASPAADRFVMVATPKASLDAAARMLAERGYATNVLGDNLEGEAREIAVRHAGQALAALAQDRRSAILSGGELTVTVTGNGRGGPNQEYALGLTLALDGADGIAAIAADTDGIDGGGGNATDPAGAMVFPDTQVRARARNLNAAKFLANNDSTGFFRELGDLVECGATQTNVNDFRLILVEGRGGAAGSRV